MMPNIRPKIKHFLGLSVLLLSSCNEPDVAVKVAGPVSVSTSNSQDETGSEVSYLTLEDAEKILGEPSRKMEAFTSKDNGAERVHCSYSANSKDAESDKTGTVYFLLEKYNSLDGAKERYTSIFDANKKNGAEAKSGLGDEAYFHTDGSNFLFIMVRKGQNVFNMKVNKLTSKVSRLQFDEIAHKITQNI